MGKCSNYFSNKPVYFDANLMFFDFRMNFLYIFAKERTHLLERKTGTCRKKISIPPVSSPGMNSFNMQKNSIKQ